jgi:hemerythrin
MKEIEWRKHYEIGLKEVDDQHKHLVEILNEMIRAKNEDRINEVLGKILKELVDYTNYHFSSEEKYMMKYGYPGTTEHKAQHKMLVKQLVKILEELKSGKMQVGDKLFGILQHWLIRHVLDHDKKFGYFLEEL